MFVVQPLLYDNCGKCDGIIRDKYTDIIYKILRITNGQHLEQTWMD